MIKCIVIAGTLYMGSAGVGPEKMMRVESFESLAVVSEDTVRHDGKDSEIVLAFGFDGIILPLGKEYANKSAYDILKECKDQVEKK